MMTVVDEDAVEGCPAVTGGQKKMWRGALNLVQMEKRNVRYFQDQMIHKRSLKTKRRVIQGTEDRVF